jgi:hypothetical protein
MSYIETNKNKCTDAQKRASSNYYQKNKQKCKENALNYMKDKYKTDEQYRTKTLERANERYKIKKLEKEEQKIKQKDFDDKMKILNEVKTANDNTLKNKELSDYIEKLYFQMFLINIQNNFIK